MMVHATEKCVMTTHRPMVGCSYAPINILLSSFLFLTSVCPQNALYMCRITITQRKCVWSNKLCCTEYKRSICTHKNRWTMTWWSASEWPPSVARPLLLSRSPFFCWHWLHRWLVHSGQSVVKPCRTALSCLLYHVLMGVTNLNV